MVFYWFSLSNYYYVLLMVDSYLLDKLKIFENISEFYYFAIIEIFLLYRYIYIMIYLSKITYASISMLILLIYIFSLIYNNTT